MNTQSNSLNSSEFKVATWNINSIRGRIEHLHEFIVAEAPDILLLQEIKCENHHFPHSELTNIPYNMHVHGQKSYNGVAILSKYPVEDIKTNFLGNPIPEQARFMEVTLQTPIGFCRIISLYAPNGGEAYSDKYQIKLDFYDALTDYIISIMSFDEKLIIGGDFNIAPFDIDVYSPAALINSTCFTQPEKEKFRALINSGMEDLYRVANGDRKEYSWWDYRGGSFEQNKGMRIDSILSSANTVDCLKSCEIHYHTRTKAKPSDHAPVIAIFGAK